MYRRKLHEMCVAKSWTFPKYSAVKDGPDHKPRFRAVVSVNGAIFESPASCKSIKEAQDKAAEAALIYFISISSTCEPNSPSPVPMNKPELQKEEDTESMKLVKSCNLKNSKSAANHQEKEIEAPKLNMNSLSLEESMQDPGLKLAKGGASALRMNGGKINPAKFDCSSSIKGKGKLISESSNTPAETSVDLKKPKAPAVSSYLLCDRVRVYSDVPDIANLPKGVTLMQICDNIWVAVSLEFAKEKA